MTHWVEIFDAAEIRELRLARRWTLAEAARNIGLTAGMLRRIEAPRQREVERWIVRKLADAVGVSRDEITTWVEIPTATKETPRPAPKYAGPTHKKWGRDMPRDPALAAKRRLVRQAPPEDDAA